MATYSKRAISKVFLYTITLSVAYWPVAFNLGAFGVIFFDQVLAVWAAATATLIAHLILPKNQFTPITSTLALSTH
jgi:hypothetical protein